MERIFLSIIFTVCIAGCTSNREPIVPNTQPPIASSSSADSVPTVPLALEQVPSELSIEHFATMRLEGTNLQLLKVLADNSAYTRHQISYSSNGVTISGILNTPKGDGPYPLVILNHGYIDPAIYTVGRGLKREQDYLARQGFAVLHTDYRGHGESSPSPDTRNVYDASLAYSIDSLNAIAAVKAANIPNVDTTRIGMLGHSMGGGVTLNIATAYPNAIQAAVLYAPVSADAWLNFERWRAESDEGESTRAYFGTYEENPSAWEKLSAKTYLQNMTAPVLLFHGTADADVPIAWSDDLDTWLTELQKDIQYVVYQNEGHEYGPQWTNFMQKTTAFLQTNLLPAATQPLSLYDVHRVTKKSFGSFITPATSLIPNDRFTGYHTGADFEVLANEDEQTMVVQAVCAGTIKRADWVSGYGGVIVQSCTLYNEPITVLYSHLNQATFTVQTGDRVTTGTPLASLGKGNTSQTDNERAHLHLSAHKGADVVLAGYTATKDGLVNWIDPLQLL